MAEASKPITKNPAPAKLELLIAIVNTPKVPYYLNLIQSFEANLQMTVQASGTSQKAIMNYLHLNQSNRSVILGVIREYKVKDVLETLDEKFNTVKDGGGVAVTVPLSSVIGTLVYGFLSNDKRTIKQ